MKPTCKRCGLPHYGFQKCDEAPAILEREQAAASLRERNKVYPVPRHDPAVMSGLRNYRQVGVNRFVRERD